MMRTALHFLFGWHFVVYTNFCGDYVRRVRFASDGSPYVRWCGQFVWLLDCPPEWRALTFDKVAWLAERIDAAGHPLPKLRIVDRRAGA